MSTRQSVFRVRPPGPAPQPVVPRVPLSTSPSGTASSTRTVETASSRPHPNQRNTSSAAPGKDPHPPSVDPAGWQSGQGYNRAHLLAAVLGGANNDKRNFVTMHAYANSPVMRGFELRVRDAVKAGENILYRATPIYSGSNPLPLGVTLSGRGNAGFSLDVTIVNRER
ncbi:DNA/RNA non-specific endonuclease [Streptomyces spongiicola]|uniref:Type VII secretion system protein EssD-like domain-containing protein n=1 Tax=Streptomyces spongiicola TaxID=1690221 RepID=A0ABM6VER7_9ACTN|nr:DNA/RNA non-specific endonuclease [Streptomyces spongiicola]AWK12899.1 hypothetical protein DDQ41_13730 [Streptomyces spongiicola]